MGLTDAERKLVSEILKLHLDSIRKGEKIPGQLPVEIAGEMRYEDFLEDILEKLKI